MKKATLLSSLVVLALPVTAEAATFLIDLSPAGGALNSGSTTYTGDYAVGISALNAVGQPVSSATGNEVGTGITYNDISNMLSFDIGYGSDFGFIDLAGDFTTAHVHGPVAVSSPGGNTGAGVQFGLDGFHSAGSSARTGRFTGSQTLSAAQEADLFDNELYINIHSGFAGGGEIRAQLVAVPEPSSALLLGIGALGIAARRHRSR